MPTLDDGPAPNASGRESVRRHVAHAALEAPASATPRRRAPPPPRVPPARDDRATWEELLEIVVDGTRDALRADVTSLYLLDRDGPASRSPRRTASTVTRSGARSCRSARGSPGGVAAMRQPIVDPRRRRGRPLPLGPRHRPAPVRRLDALGAAHLARPGRRRAQRPDRDPPRRSARPTSPSCRPSRTSSPGIVEKGRLQREAEAQVEQLRALDQARAELIALVTHELRTPLAVVRAYTDLLADEPALEGRSSRDPEATGTPAPRGTRDARADRAARPARRLDPRVRPRRPGPARRSSRPSTSRGSSASSSSELARSSDRHRTRLARSRRLHVLADPARLRQVLEHLLENAVKYAPPDTRSRSTGGSSRGSSRSGSRTRAPGSRPSGGNGSSSRTHDARRPTARGSGIGLYAARRLAESMGGRLWCEPAPPGGARFVLALPAAVAI